MNRKRILSLILALAMIFTCVSCSAEKESVSEKTPYDYGMDVISLMAEAAGTEAYLAAMGGSEGVQEMAGKVAQADYSTPKAVYSVTIEDELLHEFMAGANLDNLPESLENSVENRLFGAMITRLNSTYGIDSVAASSICAFNKMFVDEKITENMVYLYFFEETFPVAVVFTVGEGGAVMATSNVIFSEDFSTDSVEEIQELFSDYGVVAEQIK